MVNIFNPLKDLQDGKMRSASWYRNAVSLIADRTSAPKLMKDGKLLGKPSGGRMSMFYYDPKTKNKMPFYDTFPLVLPIEVVPRGFMGINFHYLPYALRFQLLQEMQRYATNGKFDKSTRINANYQSLKNVKLIKPAIKKYLWSQVRSNFLRIDADEMALACYLPVAQFQKASIGKVFADSRRRI